MATFLTIGYGNRKGYDAAPQAAKVAAHRQDAALLAEGAIIGIAGSPLQVRNLHGSGTAIMKGAFMSSDLPIAGFSLIEASDLDDAIKKVAGVPCAVTDGVVEIWPLEMLS
ncbi:MAG: hypothetical protein V2I43_04675 [Parvularcula sp.]|jgi:hypothetical protein|nr:hypothetical protein [Parvularcula sp.]